jgi:hypothetical protein
LAPTDEAPILAPLNQVSPPAAPDEPPLPIDKVIEPLSPERLVIFE